MNDLTAELKAFDAECSLYFQKMQEERDADLRLFGYRPKHGKWWFKLYDWFRSRVLRLKPSKNDPRYYWQPEDRA